MKTDTFTCVRVEGSILPTDLLQRVAAGDARLDGLRTEDYGLVGEKVNEATNHAWNRLSAAWEAFRAARGTLPPSDSGHRLTVEKWLLPLWKVLGYGTLTPVARPFVIDEKTYPVSHTAHHSPFHLVGFRHDLDKRTDADGKQFSPHGLVQEFLNRSDTHLWGFVSNGLKLRVLRDNIRLTRQAYVEFDLQAMFDGKQYADFALLWRLCHESRVTGEKPEQCWLERWSKVAAEQGLRALDQLRTGVENAVKALGRGFLACPANADLKDALRHNRLAPLDYYRQLLRLVYRLLFVFVAEDRELLCDPAVGDDAKARYAKFYSSARLRRIAERLRGTPHTDLYEGLSLVFAKMGNGGSPELALPALGGLFDPDRTANLKDCRLANADLLEAVRALSVINDGTARRSVDYRNLGAEELGSVYESLLELQPRFDPDAIAFTLESASGNERKTTGSYYTPTSLITCLLDSALDPVLAEAAAKPNAEAAILALKVCDPACGSGHFLIAAAHRIAKKLASVRTHEEEPAPAEVRHALRDVIGRCIFGVDINPMAVELCQVALWMEALEPGKPLSFLDHHVQCGNSLLGTTPALLKAGIPDEAFEPIEGDDKKVCSGLKRQNKDERRGQEGLFDDLKPWEQLGNLPEAMAKLEGLPDDTVESIREKERRYAELLKSDAAYHTSGRFLADAWCAAFVWKKVKDDNLLPMTEGRFRRIEKNPHDIGPQEFAEVRRLAGQYQFFHWHLAFPAVFRYPAKGEAPDNELTGWCGGFDVVLGNPPWEHTELKETEWFSGRGRMDIASANTSKRTKLIQELESKDPALYRAFLDDRRHADGESHIIRNSSGIDEESGDRHGLYPLCGRGRINTYAIFAELNRNLLRPTGRVGCIVPSGIATDDTTKLFFSDLAVTRSLVSLFDFENREAIFPGVHRSYKFALLTLSGPALTVNATNFVFFALQVEDLEDPCKRFTLSPDDLALLNPNTRTCPVFRTARDAELTKAIYRRVPVLHVHGKQEGAWAVSLKQGLFNISADSELIRAGVDLPSPPAPSATKSPYIPLYEGRMGHQFCHRYSTFQNNDYVAVSTGELQDPSFSVQSESWVERSETAARLQRRPHLCRTGMLGFRRVTRSTDERTCIACIFPYGACSYGWILTLGPDAVGLCQLLANYNSFVLDYLLRNSLSQPSVPIVAFEQIPIVSPAIYAKSCPWDRSQTLAEWIKTRVLELTYTANDLKPFAEDLGEMGDPYPWDDKRRAVIRAELDAAFFHLYGISEADADYILETFPIVKEKDEQRFGTYRTKEMILDCYRRMAAGDFESELEIAPGRRVPTDLFGDPVQRSRREQLIQAFVETRRDNEGVWSSELMVCHDSRRKRYLDEVTRQLPRVGEEDACLELWNARRSGQLTGLPSSTPYPLPKTLRHFDYRVEMACRYVIEQLVKEGHPKKSTTPERILCTPAWRQRFDDAVGKAMGDLPADIREQFAVHDYRMAAMSIRKRTGGKASDRPSLFDEQIPLAQAKLPNRPGVYLLESNTERLFTGWTANLQEQFESMRAAGAGSLIPSWLLDGRAPAKTIAFHPFDTGTPDILLYEFWRANLRYKLPWLNLYEEELAA